jgi:hypothetical protein
MSHIIKSYMQLALLIFVGLFVFSLTSSAATNQTVDARVKLGICGNDIAEDNEDCDNADLKGKTCKTLGYASGALSCLPSCDYDTTLCIPEVTSTSSDGGESGGFHSEDEPPFATQEAITYVIPEVVRLFDTNGDGKLTSGEIYGLTKKWFDIWKGTLEDQIAAGNQGSQVINKETWTCDLNNDGVCDLVDFSILMYYVNR